MRHNPYQQRYPYNNVRGAFYSVLSQMPNDVVTSVEHSGQTFAISGTFKYLSFAHYITSTHKDYVWSRTNHERPVQKNVKLYIASDFVLNVCGLSPSEAIAAGLHEGGHGLCDMAGSNYPTNQEFDKKIMPYIKEDSSVYLKAELPKWVNVLADGRLERGISLLIPGTDKYFYAIQNWCHRLEAENRGQDKASDFMMALRDSVKGWDCKSAREVYSEYLPEARKLVEDLKPIWSKVIPKNTKWNQTVHLPLQVALEIVNAIKDMHEFQQQQQQQQGQGQQSGDQQGGGQGQQGQGQQSGGQQDGGQQDGDQQGQDQEQQGGGQQDGDQQGQQGGSKSEDQQGGSKSGGKGTDDLDLLEGLLSGKGEALDPGSALPENIKKVERELGHKIYVPNNRPYTEERMRLK